jgi:hypothetical protein
MTSLMYVLRAAIPERALLNRRDTALMPIWSVVEISTETLQYADLTQSLMTRERELLIGVPLAEACARLQETLQMLAVPREYGAA